MATFNVKKHPIIFEEPELVKAESAWIEHIPFAFFLVDILKPKILVELGVHAGISFNAFCQAAKTLKTNTSCYGIDTWEGEVHSGFYNDTVFQELSKYQKKKYSDFSFLLKCTFDEGISHFEDNSVDLLHIDGLHTYKAVKHDFDTWYPKVKEGGVIIFHDTQVKEKDFGVWKLWAEISAKYHTYEFKHCFGLGVMIKGENPAFQGFLEEIKNDFILQNLFPVLGKRIISKTDDENNVELERLKGHINLRANAILKSEKLINSSLEAQLSSYKNELTSLYKKLIITEEELRLARQRVKKLSDMIEQMRLISRFKRAIRFFIPEQSMNFLRRSINFFLSRRTLSKQYLYSVELLNKQILADIQNFSYNPLISIIIPVYNADPVWLDKAIGSVKNQLYTNWEICIVDCCSSNEKTKKFLKRIDHSQIKIKQLKYKTNISIASNEAVKISSGKYIAFLEVEDEITSDALYEVVKAINTSDAEFIYSDEDKIDVDGSHCQPHFKANFSIDLLLSQNYISHFTVIKKELVKEVGGFETRLDSAQDYDLFLKCVEKTDKIYHISKVLYHWRIIPEVGTSEFSHRTNQHESGKIVLLNYIQRNKIAGFVENGLCPGSYRLKRDIIGNPLVSIIIPFKDKPELLKICIDSILSESTYQNYEIIGVSNNSEEPDTFNLMKYYEDVDKRIKFYQYDIPFNYSKINNYALNFVKGEHVILLNNDIEIISKEWIEALLEHSQRPEIGAVGAKLYYPDGKIQHAGIALGITGVAGHLHKLFPGDHNGYFGRLSINQNISAVTGACIMVKKKLYEEIKGLDEVNLSVSFNDVDFCLRLREKGYLNVFTPYCQAYHHESVSRGYEDTVLKKKRFQIEVDYMLSRHKEILKNGDPYYNRNLTLIHEDFSLKK